MRAFQTDSFKIRFLVVLIVFAELAPWILVYVVCLAMFAHLLITSRRNIGPLLSSCWPLLLMCLIGGIVSLLGGVLTADTVKGAYYTSRPIIFVGVGIYLCLKLSLEFRLVRSAIIAASLILSLAYIAKYVATGGEAIESRYALRDAIGVGYITIAIGASLILSDIASLRFKLSELSMLPIVATAVYLSGSRSAFVTIGLMVLSSFVPLILFPFAATVLVLALFILTTPLIQLVFEPDFLRAHFVTLPSGLVEIIAIERYSDAEVNSGWRGFETYRAFSHVWDEGVLATVFGTGWDALVPVLWHIRLGTDFLTEIPVFHNAWSFIFVRSGSFGLFLMLIQVWVWISLLRSCLPPFLNASVSGMRAFASGITLILLVSIPTLASIYNAGGTGQVLCILFGICLGYCYRNGTVSPTYGGSPLARFKLA